MSHNQINIQKRLSLFLDFLLATETQKGLEKKIHNNAIVSLAPINDRELSLENFKLALIAAKKEKRPVNVFLGIPKKQKTTARQKDTIQEPTHQFQPA